MTNTKRSKRREDFEIKMEGMKNGILIISDNELKKIKKQHRQYYKEDLQNLLNETKAEKKLVKYMLNRYDDHVAITQATYKEFTNKEITP